MASVPNSAGRVISPEVRAIIFTGGLDDVFIRHFSVEEIIDMAEGLRTRLASGLPSPRFARTPLRRVWEQVDNSQKPTIAARNLPYKLNRSKIKLVLRNN